MEKKGDVIRVAYGSVPKDGGTFTFYRNQRPPLLEAGIDLRCVTLGLSEASLWEEAYADEGCVCLAPQSRSYRHQARTFVDWCIAEKIDIVMGINSAGILSSIPHLPGNIRVMSRCANGFDHGYRITLSGNDRLMGIVALTPRLRSKLIDNYGADPALVHLIPNGIDPSPFESGASQPRGRGEVLSLGFLGRLEHKQKGVLHLPAIVKKLNSYGVHFHLRIAGKGRHENELRSLLSDECYAGQVEFVGALNHQDIPDFLKETDVFLFTSHFEGCPNALLEAMTAGAVPVSWIIEGTTDFLIEHGSTGFLCETGDIETFSSHVAKLDTDRVSLNKMSLATSTASRKRFTSAQAARAYTKLFREVMKRPTRQIIAKPWRSFRPDPNFPRSWRQWVPDPLKSAIRILTKRAPSFEVRAKK